MPRLVEDLPTSKWQSQHQPKVYDSVWWKPRASVQLIAISYSGKRIKTIIIPNSSLEGCQMDLLHKLGGTVLHLLSEWKTEEYTVMLCAVCVFIMEIYLWDKLRMAFLRKLVVARITNICNCISLIFFFHAVLSLTNMTFFSKVKKHYIISKYKLTTAVLLFKLEIWESQNCRIGIENCQIHTNTKVCSLQFLNIYQ